MALARLQLSCQRRSMQFTVWERKSFFRAASIFYFFTATGLIGVTLDRVDRGGTAAARLKLIEELAATGAGVTAVTLRGFGRTLGKPCRTRLCPRYLCSDRAWCSPPPWIGGSSSIAGESLGTWAAMQNGGCSITGHNHPPMLVSLQNPFTCMAEVGERICISVPALSFLENRAFRVRSRPPCSQKSFLYGKALA